MKKLAAFTVACAFGGISLALAHSGATGIVKERMVAMKAIAGATKAIAKLDWSNVKEARQQAKANAEILSRHAADIVRLFPQGSVSGPSEAIPAIWERPDDFARIATALEKASADFAAGAEKAERQSDLEMQFEAISATCKGCHQDFRKKK